MCVCVCVPVLVVYAVTSLSETPVHQGPGGDVKHTGLRLRLDQALWFGTVWCSGSWKSPPRED